MNFPPPILVLVAIAILAYIAWRGGLLLAPKSQADTQPVVPPAPRSGPLEEMRGPCEAAPEPDAFGQKFQDASAVAAGTAAQPHKDDLPPERQLPHRLGRKNHREKR